MLVVDEAWSKATPSDLRNAGYGGVIGYVSQDISGKNITADQVAAYHAVGLDVGLVYEFNPSSALRGSAQGITDAQIAVSGARSIGAPARVCLYAAVDFDAQPNDYAAVLSYATGFLTVAKGSGYRAGIYAGYGVVTMLEGNGYGGLLWQTYAWSHGSWAPGVAIRQVTNDVHVGTSSVDRDITMVSDWGQWTSGPANPPQLNGDALVTHWTTVRQGDSGQAVKNAQGLLLAHGLSVGSSSGQPDGSFGPVTAASTRELQQRYHIQVDGVFGPHTASVALFGVDVA